jgi:hypothetical protein
VFAFSDRRRDFSERCRKDRRGRSGGRRRFSALRLEALEPRLNLAGDITTGLVHYWTFDETSGDIAHDSAGNADGTLVNWDASEPKWSDGRVGGALDFSTADDYVTAQPPAMSGSYAVSFWLNVTDRTGINPRIFDARSGNDIFVNSESNRSVSFSSANVNTFESGQPTFNAWDHYALNFNAATGQGVIYRNGTPVAIGPFSDGSSFTSWVFGHSSDLSNTNDSLHGLLDDLRVYNRLLTDDDVALLASQGQPEATHQAPVHHWTFDETSGFTAHDVAGGADGILINWNATEPRWVPGKVGGALAFTTSDNAVVTPAVSTSGQWSVAFWVNVTAETGTNPRVLEPWAYIRLDNNQGMGFSYANSNTFDVAHVQLGKWEHYVITFDSTASIGTIYRNGVAVKSGYLGGNSPAFDLVFGHNQDLSNPNDSLNGLLDDLRIYDRDLSTAEIQQLASVGPVVTKEDSYSALEDTLLTVPVDHGVLVNDSDLDDDTPMAALAVDAVHGKVEMAGDGSFTYLPDKDYNGSDSFTYKLTDNQGNTAFATVSLTVKPVNDPPSFEVGADRFVTDMSGSRGIGHWAFNVSPGPADEAGQKLTFICTADHPELLAVQPQVVPAFDTYGSLTYTLKPNMVGVVTVTIVLQDDGGTADGGSDESPPQTFKINITKEHPSHNEILGLDVDNDGIIAASDVLSIINYIDANGSGPVDAVKGMAAPYCDVNGDGQIAADDVMELINHFNANPLATAAFVGIDSTTQGNWQSVYGADGYTINSGPTNLPSYAELSFSGEYDVAWAPSTDDPRALQLPGTTDRIASAWTGHNASSIPLNGFTMDLKITDGKQHRVAIYALDWDTVNRTQKVDVIDVGSNQIIDTEQPTPFHDGKYFIWLVSGHVQFRFTNLANGLNAVASGVFFE